MWRLMVASDLPVYEKLMSMERHELHELCSTIENVFIDKDSIQNEPQRIAIIEKIIDLISSLTNIVDFNEKAGQLSDNANK